MYCAWIAPRHGPCPHEACKLWGDRYKASNYKFTNLFCEGSTIQVSKLMKTAYISNVHAHMYKQKVLTQLSCENRSKSAQYQSIKYSSILKD